VTEVSAIHRGLALITDNLQVGDAILPHIWKQFRILYCVRCIINTVSCNMCEFVISGE